METEPQTIPDEETRQLELWEEYRAGVPGAREDIRRQQEERVGVELKDPMDVEDVGHGELEEIPPVDLLDVPF